MCEQEGTEYNVPDGNVSEETGVKVETTEERRRR